MRRRAQFDVEVDDAPPQQQRPAIGASEESGDDRAGFLGVGVDELFEDRNKTTLQGDDAQE